MAASLPASANWQDELGTLRIGMVSPSGSRAVAGLGKMTRAFEEAGGVPAEIFVARDSEALIRAIASGRVHYALLSATGYAVADAYCQCVEPLAAPRGVDGAIGVRGALIARRGQAMQELGRARVVAGSVDEVGPQVLALAALQDIASPGGYGAVLHSGSQSQAEAAFAEGQAEVLVGWVPAFADDRAVSRSGTVKRLEKLGIAPSELEIIWTSGVVAFGPHAVRRDIPVQLKVRLGSFLENLYNANPEIYALLEPYRGGGFKKIGAADYEAAARIAEVSVARR
ncbi:PhnD/SsuA/transferrin family substrate-binding protein [Mesorhizobium sp. Z1-4]|uniref:phosphate/phosphite/phosphonate ABC transporter substrate-binding protein n=1 Tax=Mesorhizobium sp. Z1-4 TaxID=2448478 RepID=UPI0013E07921|nr:PhnD/SsuA/transferrin family substrate-binding protein [Mesorhizobium sp. Z1-4]